MSADRRNLPFVLGPHYCLAMMPRPVGRMLAATFAICWGFVTLFPAFVAPCPFHDPAFAKVATVGHHTAIGHSSHVMPPAEHSNGGNTRGHQHPTSHGCTCIGCCTFVAAFALVPPPLSFAPQIISAGSSLPLPPGESEAPSRRAHTLPFSTAPPQNLNG